MLRYICLALPVWLLGLALLAGPARADGIIIPEPLPDLPRPPQLAIKYHHVEVTVRDGVATTSIDQVFVNDSPRDLEGTYLFPLPEDAAVSDFTLWVDGKPQTGRILPKDEARRIYESYVRRRVDPALLEYIGRGLFQARVFPIPARGERRVQLKYSQVVPFDSGVYSYRYPLDTERFSARPLQEVSILVRLESAQPLKTIYSPSHPVSVQRQGENRATVSYEEKNVRPSRDFQLYFAVSEKEFGLNLLSYLPRNTGEKPGDGFFLLMLSPKTGLQETRRLSKDITFVFDTSGSMSGEKIEQAKKALTFALDNLHNGDRFNLLTFSGEVETFRPQLVAADPENLNAARRFVAAMEARGGTNLNDAVLEAFRRQQPRPGTPAMIVLLTDGLPTVGTTDTQEILNNTEKARTGNTRLFAFGVGDDVNTHLLDRLSGDNGGVSEYVRPGEDLEVKVSSFYKKIATPVLANLALDYGGAAVYDVYPKRLPDLFAGSQLLVFGRYRNGGRFPVTLRGEAGGKERAFIYPADFSGEDPGRVFIPRLWATRKVGYLLDELRLHGYNKELVDEVTRLGTEYGIVTPYTSSLVEEEPHLAANSDARDMAAAMPAPGAAAPKAAGASAVSAAQQVRARKEATQEQNGYETVRHVAGKTFVLRNGVWTDTAYRPGMKQRSLPFASDEYFALIAREPQLAQYLALGERVLVVWKEEALAIAPAP